MFKKIINLLRLKTEYVRIEKGFTLMETLLTLFGLSLMLAIIISFVSVSLDQSSVVGIDSEVVRSEQKTKSWILKDLEENFIKNVEIVEASDSSDILVFTVETKDYDEDGNEVWLDSEITYLNKQLNSGNENDRGFFRFVDGLSMEMSPFEIEKLDITNDILTISFNYIDFTKEMKIKLKY